MKVEIKEDGEEFQEFDKYMNCYRITFWKEEIKSMQSLESSDLFFNQKHTCKQLVQTLSKTFNIPLKTLHVWHGKKILKVTKGVLIGTEDKEDEDGNANRSLRSISLLENHSIYIEKETGLSPTKPQTGP